ncbi:hypothetical protein SELSPUOL_00296 [Selenomonas sputigena ATCC 35185]|uniref:Uncharacterized protein n=1 Tax=Selenomonas sputigena (strain ATCC 35185 / DSM 20758 / CCUG 44933 / VPI D19B-28) TaxID=546271 RepID=C9LS73_SELS3|nr:hypothetical protein SELSPUOL_00296 [Selenomonas sputigena ATCC 35185]
MSLFFAIHRYNVAFSYSGEYLSFHCCRWGRQGGFLQRTLTRWSYGFCHNPY